VVFINRGEVVESIDYQQTWGKNHHGHAWLTAALPVLLVFRPGFSETIFLCADHGKCSFLRLHAGGKVQKYVPSHQLYNMENGPGLSKDFENRASADCPMFHVSEI